ncbi:MAG: hypothetical protein FJX77_04190 [Armatimonadetes bacterium]|nr:hypothetical protein [Armatimonadota bacterium]
MDAEELKRWRDGWQAAKAIRDQEPLPDYTSRLRTLDSLYDFVLLLGDRYPRTDESDVWERWRRLKELHAQRR